MVAVPPAASPGPTRPPHVGTALPGGIAAVHLGGLSEADLEVALRVDAEWLLVDARTCDAPATVAIAAIEHVCSQMGRPLDRTCALIHGPVDVGSLAAFRSAADACQMKLFHDAGYGLGWGSRTSMV